MNALQYLFAGFAVFWAGLFIYLLILQARLRSLQHEVEQLEERLAEADAPPTSARATTARATDRPAAPGAERTPTGA